METDFVIGGISLYVDNKVTNKMQNTKTQYSENFLTILCLWFIVESKKYIEEKIAINCSKK